MNNEKFEKHIQWGLKMYEMGFNACLNRTQKAMEYVKITHIDKIRLFVEDEIKKESTATEDDK